LFVSSIPLSARAFKEAAHSVTAQAEFPSLPHAWAQFVRKFPARYFAAAHVVQIPPSTPEYPALQVQLVGRVLPGGEWEWRGQSSHLKNPLFDLYFPATHKLHVVIELAT